MKARWLALVCVALLACDKGSSSKGPVGSGALSADELALFKNLPAGGNVVIGGNYMKVQAWVQSAMGDAMAAMGPGWKEYSQCWAGLTNVKLAGTVVVVGSVELRMAFAGATLEDMKRCGDKAGFKSTLDPDGKFLSMQVTTMGQTVEQGMLLLPSGAIYMRQAIAGLGAIVPGARADLEADTAKLAQATALDDPKLQKLVAKVDRSKTLWFAGTAAGTSIADTLGEVYGTVDIAPGMSVDITAEVLDKATADKVVASVDDVKKNSGQLPAEMRSVFETLSVNRDGNHLRVRMKVTDAQLASLMKQMPFGRGM